MTKVHTLKYSVPSEETGPLAPGAEGRTAVSSVLSARRHKVSTPSGGVPIVTDETLEGMRGAFGGGQLNLPDTNPGVPLDQISPHSSIVNKIKGLSNLEEINEELISCLNRLRDSNDPLPEVVLEAISIHFNKKNNEGKIDPSAVEIGESLVSHICHDNVTAANSGLWATKHFHVNDGPSEEFFNTHFKPFLESIESRLKDSEVVVIEFGGGSGADAERLCKIIPNVEYYIGLEASTDSADSIKDRLSATDFDDLKVEMFVGDYWDHLRELIGRFEVGDLQEKVPVIFAKSSTHYYALSKFISLLKSTSELAGEKGLFILTMKTPASRTWQDHYLLRDNGYQRGVHPTEKVSRSAITPMAFGALLKHSGFENQINSSTISQHYDTEDGVEIFNVAVVSKNPDTMEDIF